MEIKNPRRILIIGPPDSGVLTLLKDLTGNAPTPRTLPCSSTSTSASVTSPSTEPPQTTTAGTSHALPIKTPYYSATLPIWLDETTHPPTWAADFMSDEADEVVRAVGAWIVVFRTSCLTNLEAVAGTRDGVDASRHAESAVEAHRVQTDDNDAATDSIGRREIEEEEEKEEEEEEKEEEEEEKEEEEEEKKQTLKSWTRNDILTTLTSIRSIIARAHGDSYESWDGVCLAVGMPGGSVSSLSSATAMENIKDEAARQEEWEELCWEAGFEYVECRDDVRAGGMSGCGAERDEFGEVKGLARVREALEANEWEDVSGEWDGGVDGEEGELDWLDDDRELVGGEAGVASAASSKLQPQGENAGFDLEKSEMKHEFLDLRMAIQQENDDKTMPEGDEAQAQDVEQLDVLLRKMLAVKEMSGHLTEGERKRMARRVVAEVMDGGGEGLFE